MWCSPLPCNLVRPRTKLLPQHPFLKHPLPMFLPQCERPRFTSRIQKNTQNYNSAYFNRYLFG
jgi:hypothetical protein